MAGLWSLRGLSWRELAGRTCRRSWEDEVFGQAARLAFHYFLGIFPALLLLLVLLRTFAGTGSDLRNTLLDSIQQIVPRDASALIAKTTGELNARAAIGASAVWAVLSSAWAILNGTWAMMSGLNKAYEVKEERPWWRILTLAFGSTISLGDYGPYGTNGNPLWQQGWGDYQSPSWLAYSGGFLAHHAMAGDSNIAPLLVCFAISLWAKLKRSKVAMEYTRCGRSNRVVGQFDTAASDLSGALELFPKDL
jgi:Virulence factor BrkB